jgi:hypothetical protein
VGGGGGRLLLLHSCSMPGAALTGPAAAAAPAAAPCWDGVVVCVCGLALLAPKNTRVKFEKIVVFEKACFSCSC